MRWTTTTVQICRWIHRHHLRITLLVGLCRWYDSRHLCIFGEMAAEWTFCDVLWCHQCSSVPAVHPGKLLTRIKAFSTLIPWFRFWAAPRSMTDPPLVGSISASIIIFIGFIDSGAGRITPGTVVFCVTIQVCSYSRICFKIFPVQFLKFHYSDP